MFRQLRLEKLAARLRAYNIPVRIALWNGQSFDLGEKATVVIRATNPAGLRHLVRPSLDALGSADVEGNLDVEGDLDQVFGVATQLARRAVRPLGRFGRIVRSAHHTREMDAEAIAHYYDVSDDFYRLWLDENMVYSCAYFKDHADSLEEAQIQKLDHVLRKNHLQPDQRLLDIGCGWGALILRAAERSGAHCTGITLSRHQHELAWERIAAAGLADRCQVLLADYRDMDGQFDRITSISMFEHVGLKNLRSYFLPSFATCSPTAASRSTTAMGATLRIGSGAHPRHGRRNALSHLENVPRRLRLFVRPRLGVDLPDPGGQVLQAANRQTAADAQLHVQGNLLNNQAVRV